MSQEEYRKSASEVDLEEEERVIQRDGTIAFFATAGLFAAGYYGLAGIVEFPTAIGERFALSATASMFFAFWVLVAIVMFSTGRRKSAKDIGGAAAGPPSDQIAIQVAFLQNTLEQAFLAVVFFAGLAAVASGPWLALIVVSVVLFAVGRILFYRGYPDGAKGRALGMSLTMMPVIIGYPLIIVLVVIDLV